MLRRLAVIVVSAFVVGPVAPAAAGPAAFPEVIELPDGFQPEGIDVGTGTEFFVGSIPTGAVYRGDLRTGDGDVLVPGREGRAAIGLKEAGGLLYVAGGPTGQAFIYDAETGADVATHQLAASTPTFVNDVVVTRTHAFFTDSMIQVLYRLDRSSGEVTTIPLEGDIVFEEGFNANGIDATPNGKTLVLVQSNTGQVFSADPETGFTREIDLGGETVPNGDGILLHGRTLYVVQNRMNVVAVISLAPDFSSGEVVERVGHAEFDVPTTIARFGNTLYAVNARFETPPMDDTRYWIVGLPRP